MFDMLGDLMCAIAGKQIDRNDRNVAVIARWFEYKYRSGSNKLWIAADKRTRGLHEFFSTTHAGRRGGQLMLSYYWLLCVSCSRLNHMLRFLS